MRVSTLSPAKEGSPWDHRVASMRTECQMRRGKNLFGSSRLRNLSAGRKTSKRFTIRRGRNFLPATYGVPMESDSQVSCSRQYGTRLFPGMGATGHLRKALANRPRVIRRFGGSRLALAERRRRDDQSASWWRIDWEKPNGSCKIGNKTIVANRGRRNPNWFSRRRRQRAYHPLASNDSQGRSDAISRYPLRRKGALVHG